MRIDFEKYKVLRLQQRSIVNQAQVRRMGQPSVIHLQVEQTAEGLRRAIVEKFIRYCEDPADPGIVHIRGDCFVVNHEDLERMVTDAYAAGLRSKQYWARYDITPPTMED